MLRTPHPLPGSSSPAGLPSPLSAFPSREGSLCCATRSRRLPSLGLSHSVYLWASPYRADCPLHSGFLPNPGNPVKRTPRPPEAKREDLARNLEGKGVPLTPPLGSRRWHAQSPPPRGACARLPRRGVVTAPQPSQARPGPSSCARPPLARSRGHPRALTLRRGFLSGVGLCCGW